MKQRNYLGPIIAGLLLAGGAYGQDDDKRAIEKSVPQLSAMAEEAIESLAEANSIAETLWDDAYGYAVFDATKGGLIVTGVGGTGVAQTKRGKEPVAMHLGGAGIGFGAGLENYKLLILLQDEETYEQFITGAWGGAISAQAAAGESGVSAVASFQDGVAAFRMTEGGLIAQADVTAIRFWPSAQLNDPEA